MFDKLSEECGIFGIYSSSKTELGPNMYFGLFALQHRGQDSAGIYFTDGETMSGRKGKGLVNEVFKKREELNNMVGNAAIGHVRYKTAQVSKIDEINAQPIMVETKYGKIAIAHNGHLLNYNSTKKKMETDGSIFQTEVDSEVILNLITKSKCENIEEAIIEALLNVVGSYSLLILLENKMFAIRDPFGIRPLVFGNKGNSFIVSSESCGIKSIGGDVLRDVNPGELIIFEKDEYKSIQYSKKSTKHLCSFEYIYFARPDSIMDNINIYKSRVRLGIELAKETQIEADIVVGVPDSGIPAAIGFSDYSKIMYGEGFVKNKYSQRSFIKPTQTEREEAVSAKLSPLISNIEGKRVIVIDDSLVRGTTALRLVNMLKISNAKEIHFLSASPKIINPCHFGINTPSKKELISANYSTEEIAKFIGANSVYFLSIEGMLNAIKSSVDNRCIGCFKNNSYPISIEDNINTELLF